MDLQRKYTCIFVCVFLGENAVIITKSFMYQVSSEDIRGHADEDSGILKDEMFKSTVIQKPIPENDNCPKMGDISDWTLQCKYNCRAINMTFDSPSRVQLVPVCDQDKGYLVRELTQVTDSTPVLQFQHPCIRTFLRLNCSSNFPVPNIVHYVWYNMRPMRFYHFLSVYSVFKIQKPCVIFIHGDFMPTGEYWNFLLKIVPNILFLQQIPPVEIANKTILHIEHKTDITRLNVLKEYGGIYMDTDEILLRTLDPLRKHQFTLSKAFDVNLSNGLILSARDAGFLNIWIKAYDTYDPNKWGYHSTIMPAKLSKIYPDMIHVENKTFVRPDAGHTKDLFQNNFDWSNNYAIHLFMRYYKKVYSLTSIRTLNCTLGTVARFILFGHKELCTK
ncbi:uncharacterized protein [Argopecten irradians]|uniref:uncharacterized protein n=1 Tax=Argopecten irradians TaxID=31199 RepID=UPI0037181585